MKTVNNAPPPDARTIAPGYVITSQREVWSVARISPGKSGSTRTLQPRRLKPDGGRVWLSVDGQTTRVSVAALFREHWPELAHRMVQQNCRVGHPLTPDNVALWGSGNRICRLCNSGAQSGRSG